MALDTEAAGGHLFPRVQWSAVVAGVVLAVAAHIVMGLVGATLGLAAEPADSQGIGAAAAIWALVTPFVASLLGAWLACRMAWTEHDQRSAYVHGVLVWCIGLIAGALFLTGTLATGAMSAGTAASGNLGQAQRMFRGPEAPRAEVRGGEARADEAARRAAAGTGGAALGSLAGLLGAVVGAGLSRRRRQEGRKGLGWRIAIQRRDEGRAGEGHPVGTSARHAAAAPRTPAAAGGPPEVAPSDPYHH
jgi:hypothetical protein